MNVFERYSPEEAEKFLKKRTTAPSVNVSKLHPVMQGRLVAGYEKWEENYPGVRLRMLSGTRTYKQQAYLYKKYGSPRAAHPKYSRGRDFEKIKVVGSLHQKKGRRGQKKYGWAVDFERPSVGWQPVWDIFESKGIVFVLRKLPGRQREQWHATVRAQRGWFSGPFPKVPGVWRKLFLNDIGADVKVLQKQLGGLSIDGHFGRTTRTRVVAVQASLGVKRDGNWGSTDQRRYEAVHETKLRIVIPDSEAIKAVVSEAKRDVVAIVANAHSKSLVLETAAQLNRRLDQISTIVSD